MKAIFESFAQTTSISLFFVPSIGNSGGGGSIIVWKILKFEGELCFQNSYTQFVEFLCKLTNKKWILTNVYAPCTTQGEMEFLYQFTNIMMPAKALWMVVGDFNLIRRQEDRNKPGET